MIIETKEFNKLMELNPSWEFWTRFESTHAVYIRISDVKSEEFLYNIVMHDTYCVLQDKEDNIILKSNFPEIVKYLTMSREKLKQELIEAINNEEYAIAIALVNILRDDY